MAKPLQIFFSYAHEDGALMHEVRKQLVIFERNGLITKSYDRQIPPGDNWSSAIDEWLTRSDVILLFVSPDFIESKYIYEIEMVEALRRHDAGEARVIPIILRPCPWQEAPFSSLQALPEDGKPITQWPDRDAVCLEVAKAIMQIALKSREENKPAVIQTPKPGKVTVERQKDPPIVTPDDPQKKRWGGKSQRNGRKLSAQLVEGQKKYFVVNFAVSSTDGSPLRGPVYFYLHDSYSKSTIKITKIRDNKTAILEEVDAEETFTVGAQVQDQHGSWTGLELDLEQLAAFKKYRP